MRLRQVHHMDVVTDATAVGRLPVPAIYLQALESPHRYLKHVRQNVARGALRILAQQAACVGADRIEVAQRHDRKLRPPAPRVLDYLLANELGAGVWIRRARSPILRNRLAVLAAIYRAGPGKDHLVYIVSNHGVEQTDCCTD